MSVVVVEQRRGRGGEQLREHTRRRCEVARDEEKGSYFSALCIDVRAIVEELVNEVKLARERRKVEGGLATLRWGSG